MPKGLEMLGSRVVVPLRRVDRFAAVSLPSNLAPVFEIMGIRCFMETPKLAAVPAKILKIPVALLNEQQHSIMSRLIADVILAGLASKLYHLINSTTIGLLAN